LVLLLWLSHQEDTLFVNCCENTILYHIWSVPVIEEEVSDLGSYKGYGVNIDWTCKERPSIRLLRRI